MATLRRYGLHGCATQPFETLSGGQQARLQILLLELAGANLLLLDEPTDNLDLASAEALEEALDSFVGTVVAVTHDRWFLRALRPLPRASAATARSRSTSSPSSPERRDLICGHASERSHLRLHRERAARPGLRLRFLVRARPRPDPARGARRPPTSTAARSWQAYKELQLGIVVVGPRGHAELQPAEGAAVLVVPDSQVRAYIDDEFHSFVGCASEAVASPHMPPFKDKAVRLESHCAAPPGARDARVEELRAAVRRPRRRDPAHLAVARTTGTTSTCVRMCDSMSYVIDPSNTRSATSARPRRAGVLVNLDQAKMFVQGVANERMWNYHWKPGALNPKAVIKGFKMMGVDTSPWDDRTA